MPIQAQVENGRQNKIPIENNERGILKEKGRTIKLGYRKDNAYRNSDENGYYLDEVINWVRNGRE